MDNVSHPADAIITELKTSYVLQLGIKHAHFPSLLLPLRLPLLLHDLTGQDKVVRLHISAGHADSLHSKYAQLCGHSILALLLDHRAPDVVNLAAPLRRRRLGLNWVYSRLRNVEDLLSLPTPDSSFFVRRVRVTIAGIHRLAGAAVCGGRWLVSGSALEGQPAKNCGDLRSDVLRCTRAHLRI
ncbi:unnamed protein product [Menidia menidia]|uniref:(Atlantic silverside) hypothetical protein n=1 Tax=Menidia menidia TaxID=238744 RepID=A0A8S4B028_9TELE|nr:unnamed protein product [Menidia menidia]